MKHMLAQHPCCLLHQGESRALSLRKDVAIKNAAFPDRSLALSLAATMKHLPQGLRPLLGKPKRPFSVIDVIVMIAMLCFAAAASAPSFLSHSFPLASSLSFSSI